MRLLRSFQTRHGEARIVDSAKSIDSALRRQAFAGRVLDFRYYELLEETVRNGFDYRYAILTNDRTGQTAVQPFFAVDQSISDGLPASLRRMIAPVQRRFPRFLKFRAVVAGCAANEGGLDSSEPWAVEALEETLQFYARLTDAGLIFFKDFPASYRPALGLLTERGYTRIPSMPATQLDLDFDSFEEYMAKHLSRGYRSNLRQKFRDSALYGPMTMEVVADASAIINELFPLYLQTWERSEFRFEKLTPDYFRLIGQRMPERTRFFLWRRNGRLAAFILCVANGTALYDLNVGIDYTVGLDQHLYFVAWRDLVSWAVAAKFQTLRAGQLNYDPKFRLRLKLVPLDLYARQTSPVLNRVFAVALRFLQPARYDPTLRRFANARELD